MSARPGFFWDERCFWFSGGNYAFTLPVGGLVQPLAAGGLPENPETKRRFKNLLDATGMMAHFAARPAEAATQEDLRRVHPASYLEAFKEASDGGGGELGLRTPFGAGGYELCALSAGLAKAAVADVLSGAVPQAYALSRPPGHHCLPYFPTGFCLFNNIAIAVEAARATEPDLKVAVLDWDVHHGNGTEAIYRDRDDTLTISLHQERNYPLDTGDADTEARANINVPLPPGAGHASYLHAMERIVLPALESFAPDIIVVACGFDAAAIDPLSRMLATAETFAVMTEQVKGAAERLCDGKVVLVHEGGYSEVYVPFCGHAVLEVLAPEGPKAPDPLAATFAARQPGARFEAFASGLIDELAAFHGTR
ncbi:MAG: class II histone deacetylase [Pseudomonadota bacterium]